MIDEWNESNKSREPVSRRNDVERAHRQSGAVHVLCISRIAFDQQRPAPVPVLCHNDHTEPGPVYYFIKNRVSLCPLQMFEVQLILIFAI